MTFSTRAGNRDVVGDPNRDDESKAEAGPARPAEMTRDSWLEK